MSEEPEIVQPPIRVTIFCPDVYLDDGNQLALVLGLHHDDVMSFKPADWEDATGNLYSIASLRVSQAWLSAAGGALVKPAFAEDADLNAAQRAQSLLNFWALDNQIQADPSYILVVPGVAAKSALVMAGISMKEETLD